MENKKKKISIRYDNQKKDFECKNDSNFEDLMKFCISTFNLQSFENYFLKINSNNEIIQQSTKFSSLIDKTLIIIEKKPSIYTTRDMKLKKEDNKEENENNKISSSKQENLENQKNFNAQKE